MPDIKRLLSDNAANAQAFLFAEGGSLSISKLSTLLGVDESATVRAVEELANFLEGTGMCVIRTDSDVALATSPRSAETVRKVFEEALNRDIGNAGLEVLAIILYRGSSTRAHIDHIRGVNTGSTIRLLLSRGLIEREQNPADAREYLYRPTTDLLAHLGVRAVSELPDYATIRSELENFEKSLTPFDHHDRDTADT